MWIGIPLWQKEIKIIELLYDGSDEGLEEWPVAGRVICQGDGDLAPSQIPLSQWLDYCMYYINRNAQVMQEKQHTCTRVYVYTVQVVHN